MIDIETSFSSLNVTLEQAVDIIERKLPPVIVDGVPTPKTLGYDMKKNKPTLKYIYGICQALDPDDTWKIYRNFQNSATKADLSWKANVRFFTNIVYLTVP